MLLYLGIIFCVRLVLKLDLTSAHISGKVTQLLKEVDLLDNCYMGVHPL